MIAQPVTTLHELIERQARVFSDSVAIMAPDRTPLTYRGLSLLTTYMHTVLRGIGIKHNDRVAIILPNGPEAATAFLGVSSYCASAPLSSEHKQEEFAYFLSRLKARAIIVQRGHETNAIPAARSKDIHVLELVPELQNSAGSYSFQPNVSYPTDVGKTLPQPSDVALLLFTSGTTSTPKLVPLTHRNICNSIYNISKSLELTENDRCLNIMPLYHAHAIFTPLLASLQVGGTIICSPGFNEKHFFSWLFEEQPTWYSAVPTIHQSILRSYRQGEKIKLAKSLRFIRSASSSLPPTVYKELREIFDVPVIEAYGLSEAASVVTTNPLPPKAQKVGSVGTRIGTDVEIISEEGKFLSANEVGEIIIRGASVMSSYDYLSAEVVEEERFIDNWFKTGDQGYFDDEGYLFIVGRTKEIINRGGKKVVPLEVDNICLSHPLVDQAVTFGVPHPTLGEDVVTAIVHHKDAQISDIEVRRYLSMTLADFKIPSQIIFVEEIPKSSTGKVRRNELGLLFKNKLRMNFVTPRNDIENIISGVWTQILAVEQVGIDDNFFGLGGDSLLLAQVHAKICDLLDLNIPIVDLFEYPNIRALSDYLQKKQSDSLDSRRSSDRANQIKQGKLRVRELRSKNKKSNT